MRQSTCGEIRTSVLGFGCGSVLGRVGRGASLRALNAAWDTGITLFDTARSYGFGEAEAVLGDFLRGKRNQAIVATKFGIDPQKQSTLKRLIVPVVRTAVQMKVPGVRKLVRRGNASEAEFGHFTVEGLRSSLETSLKQLRTDYVDVLYLHEASASSIRQQDLMTELDALIKAGKVRRVGLYANAEVVAEGMANRPATLGAMQYGANPFHPLVAAFPDQNQRGMLLIGNHPFGSEQRMARFAATLAAMAVYEGTPTDLREKLLHADWQTLLEALLGVALNGIGAHALVFSMMREDHLRANARAIENCRFTDVELKLMQKQLLISPVTAPARP